MQEHTSGDTDLVSPFTRVSGVALNVTNLDASKAFYTDVLGMAHALTLPVPGKGLEFVMTMSGKATPEETPIILANLGEGPGPGSETFGRVAIMTSDAEAIANRAMAGGYAVTKYDLPEGIEMVVYFITDPDGYRIEVVQGMPPDEYLS